MNVPAPQPCNTFVGGEVTNTISASGLHSCAISRRTRRIACWGGNRLVRNRVPRVPVLQVATSDSHGCSITVASETLLCWGWGTNEEGSMPVPANFGPVAQVAVSIGGTCAVTKHTNRLMCWGEHWLQEIPTSGLFAHVSIGAWHACAITFLDRRVFCWMLEGPEAALPRRAVLVPSGLEAAAVAVGWWHSCAIAFSNRSLVCWGDNSRNQTALPSGLGPVAQVATGMVHTCAISLSDRVLTCWGYNDFGQTDVPRELGSVAEVTIGAESTCARALSPPSRVLCWGLNGRIDVDIEALVSADQEGKGVPFFGTGTSTDTEGKSSSRSLPEWSLTELISALCPLVLFAFLHFYFMSLLKQGRRFRAVHSPPFGIRHAADDVKGPEEVDGVEGEDEGTDGEVGSSEDSPLVQHATTTPPHYWTNQWRRRRRRQHRCPLSRTADDASGAAGFNELLYADDTAHQQFFQDLLNKTYRPVVTQDRPCPQWPRHKENLTWGGGGSSHAAALAGGSVGCARRPGGCPCVQLGSTPGLPAQFRLRSVLRVENSQRWAQYERKRKSLHSRPAAGAVPSSTSGFAVPCRVSELRPPVITTGFVKQQQVAAAAGRQLVGELDEASGEVYLFHGTSARNALRIAHEHFRAFESTTSTSFSRAGRSCMYGPGLYFTESSTKADEHSMDDEEKSGHFHKIFAMLLCRVSLGKILYTTEKDPEAVRCLHNSSKGGAAQYHSIVGDRAKAAGTFREFVLRDNGQVYPEYVLLYERVLQADLVVSPPLPLLRFGVDPAFIAEVPVYWVSYYQNPWTEAFKRQCLLRKHVVPSLLRLVEASASPGGRWRSLVLLRAKRLECAQSWTRFLTFKHSCRERLRSQGWDPSRDSSSSLPSVMTTLHDSEGGKVAKDEEGEVFSRRAHLEADLNEFFLWHGTTKEAAKCIMEEMQLQIPEQEASKSSSAAAAERVGVGEASTPPNTLLGKPLSPEEGRPEHATILNGRRFGSGAYFSDDFLKSLHYAKPDSDGVRHVFLCRVVCGCFIYTEEKKLPDPPEEWRRCDCLIARPGGTGPKEFVARNSQQVYPEYLLECRVAS